VRHHAGRFIDVQRFPQPAPTHRDRSARNVTGSMTLTLYTVPADGAARFAGGAQTITIARLAKTRA